MAKSPPSPLSLSEKSPKDAVEFSSFETSAMIIKRNGWKIPTPIQWETHDEDRAQHFIKAPPQRDKRKLLDKNRFRLLYVSTAVNAASMDKLTSVRLACCPQMSRLGELKCLIEITTEYGWTGERFRFFFKNSTAGSAVLESTESISFIAQTPTDDDYPYFCISVADKYTDGYQRDSDWVSLILTGPDLPKEVIESLLTSESFPHDYPELRYLDFMFLPAVLLRWQVEQITTNLNSIKAKIMKQDAVLLSSTINDAKNIRNNVFEMRRNHLMLHRRWTFARELADNLVRCFDKVEKRNSSETNMVKYSATLREMVEAQDDILKTLLHDLDATIDNLISITIAKNSQISAEETRRDSRSMKTIAMVTLIFLPGTFVASLFSMSMFDWEAGRKEGQLVSTMWLWVYFAIAGPLTIFVLLLWAASRLQSRLSGTQNHQALLPLQLTTYHVQSSAKMARHIVISGDAPSQMFLLPREASAINNNGGPQGFSSHHLHGGAGLIADLLEDEEDQTVQIHKPDLINAAEIGDQVIVELENPHTNGQHSHAFRFKSAKQISLSARWLAPALPLPDTNHDTVSVWVLHDAGPESTFSNPDCKAAIALFRNSRPRFLIYHMSRPLCFGNLWDALRRGPYVDANKQDPEQVIVVLSADDLRAEGIELSYGLSWEKTCEDFVEKLGSSGKLVTLVTCAHLIVRFGCDGVIYHRGLQAAKPYLVFDPQCVEGEFYRQHLGSIPGEAETFVAGFAQGFIHSNELSIERGIESGLWATRRLSRYGLTIKEDSPGSARSIYQSSVLMNNLGKGEHDDKLLALSIPSDSIASGSEHSWSLIDHLVGDPAEVARRIVQDGITSPETRVPLTCFGNLVLFDRQEIELFRTLFNFLKLYFSSPKTKPLSIALCGPRGAGKAFAALQVAKSAAKGQIIQELRFDLAQFTSPSDLLAAFHSVRDCTLEGSIPLVYFSGFDASFLGSDLGWLPHLLPAMLGGRFSDQGVSRPIGPAIFFFGTTRFRSYSELQHRAALDTARVTRLQDFLGCLHGFVNVLGPSRVDYGDGVDRLYPVRRAVILRSLLEAREPNLKSKEKISIDESILNGLLLVPTYRHGIRSLKTIIAMSRVDGRRSFERAALPPPAQLDAHVDYAEFTLHMSGIPLPDRVLEKVAIKLHETYLAARKIATPDELDDLKSWKQLSEELKESSRAHAMSISQKLRHVSYYLSEKQGTREPIWEFTPEQIDLLAEVEHDRWNSERLQNQWGLGEREPGKRKSPFLIPWADLEVKWQDIDRAMVAAYPSILRSLEGYAIYPMGPKR
ncbi:hypothetical protein AK830_g8045 [Neonectria ditissima]|uniref:Ryanodine receptor Ryr domain-containing protein n=1 Tax=Neonectria ditissima TaxID=78410 RepID=A0A0P7B8W7_9HYPO|nr:hypothetical protein AK830_g8045 [Neonectria ditissima]